MFSSLIKFIQDQLPQPPGPPAATIIVARLPADGSSPCLVPLKTRPTREEATDCFLVHIPDFSAYWKSPISHRYRDIYRLELQLLSQSYKPYQALNHRILLSDKHRACTGTYYVFYSFALDHLPQNKHVPKWLNDRHTWWGDVFFVKVAEQEFDTSGGWAMYEDVKEDFLEVLDEGPACDWRRA